MLFYLLAFALVVLIAVYVFYAHYYLPYIIVRNASHIPGPTPAIFYGNWLTVRQHEKLHDSQAMWMNAYGSKAPGRTILYFLGIQPHIFTSNMEIVKTVLITKAKYFMDRQAFPFWLAAEDLYTDNIATTQGEQWRKLRRMLSPLVTAKKMGALAPLYEPVLDRLKKRISAECARKGFVELQEWYGMYTMEIVLTTSFGRDVDSKSVAGGDLCRAIAHIFTGDPNDPGKKRELVFSLLSHNSWINEFCHFFVRFSKLASSFDTVYDTVKGIVKDRRDSSIRRNDILQTMLDAFEESTDDSTGDRVTLTNKEIIDNSILFIFGGYETSRNTMAITSYLIATHPHVQDRIQNDIQDYYANNPDSPLFEAADSLTYLEMIVLEALRVFPPGHALGRICVENCPVGGDVVIQKGTVLSIAISEIHNNPEYWPDPMSFDPERFHPDRKIFTGSYLSFGAGPRNCMGKRLGLMNAKVGLVSLMRDFRFEVTEQTKPPLAAEGVAFLFPQHGINLKLVPHNTT